MFGVLFSYINDGYIDCFLLMAFICSLMFSYTLSFFKSFFIPVLYTLYYRSSPLGLPVVFKLFSTNWRYYYSFTFDLVLVV